jgi:hypothetical protein
MKARRANPPHKADLHWQFMRDGLRLETIDWLHFETHCCGLQLSKPVVLAPGTLPAVPGVSLTRGRLSCSKLSQLSVRRDPLGLDSSWISLEVQPAFVVLFRPQPLGLGAQPGAGSVVGRHSQPTLNRSSCAVLWLVPVVRGVLRSFRCRVLESFQGALNVARQGLL